MGYFREKFNWVTVLLGLVAALFLYGVWKYLPPYFQAREVDESLARVKYEAIRVPWERLNSREGEVMIERLIKEIEALGVDPGSLEVYFSEDFDAVHADYATVVVHPVIGATTLEFHRRVEIPRDIDEL